MNNHRRPYGTPEPSDEREQQTAAALDAFIAALDAGAQPAMPTTLPPDDLAAFELATRLHHHPVSDRTESPSATFVADLGARLMAQIAVPSAELATTTPKGGGAVIPANNSGVTGQKPVKRQPSRRAVLTSGLAAAAGLAAGVAGGILVEHAAQSPAAPTGKWDVALVGGNGDWLAVATVNEIAPGSVKKFSTPNLIGHLIRRTDGSFYALSAACTHMGCIVAWNAGQRTFDCPCHNGRFDGQGVALPNQPIPYRPLPDIATKQEGNKVYVWVPAPAVATPTTQATTDTNSPYGRGNPYGD